MAKLGGGESTPIELGRGERETFERLLSSRRCRIIVNTKFDALHHWAEAGNFLAHPHHHQFFVTVEIETKPGDMDRSLEFFEVRKTIDTILERMFPKVELTRMNTQLGGPNTPLYRTDTISDMGQLSCEALADKVYEQLPNYIPSIDNREVRIKIMEDNYAGSETVYTNPNKREV